jgi:hypothetical protein
MVRSSWFLVLSSWFLVLGSWFLVRSSWFLVLGSWFLVLGSWFLVLGSGIGRGVSRRGRGERRVGRGGRDEKIWNSRKSGRGNVRSSWKCVNKKELDPAGLGGREMSRPTRHPFRYGRGRPGPFLSLARALAINRGRGRGTGKFGNQEIRKGERALKLEAREKGGTGPRRPRR